MKCTNIKKGDMYLLKYDNGDTMVIKIVNIKLYTDDDANIGYEYLYDSRDSWFRRYGSFSRSLKYGWFSNYKNVKVSHLTEDDVINIVGEVL